MKYFTRNEFVRTIPVEGGEDKIVDWLPYYPKEHLAMLDEFRERWGNPVYLSPSPYGLGRFCNGTSKHCVHTFGKVLAFDIMPKGMRRRQDAEKAIAIAEAVGFTGIGVYPDWDPRPGLHLDYEGRNGIPGRWGAKRTKSGAQEYITMANALTRFLNEV